MNIILLLQLTALAISHARAKKMNKNIQLPRPSVVSSMLQMKNINPFAPLVPPATSSFTQPVVTKIDMCEIIYHQAVQASITSQNQEENVGTYWLVLKAYSVNG